MKNTILLEKIGFSDEMINKYLEFDLQIGDKISSFADKYYYDNEPIKEVLEKIYEFEKEDLSRYSIELVFAVECALRSFDKYKELGIDEKIYFDTMKDIKCKADESLTVKGVLGMFCVEWFDGYFRAQRLCLGRLQYDYRIHSGREVEYEGIKVKEGDFVLECHIPSTGSLRHELCEESYAMAYDFFKGKLKGDILPIFCNSWLFYPPYQDIFKDGSNTKEFVRDFYIYDTEPRDGFNDGWRIFGTEDLSNIEKLPQNSSMQKGFYEYMKRNDDFGVGNGLILYNGKTKEILTRK